MECAKPASASAHARRWGNALQKSLFFILYHIFLKKSSVQSFGLVTEPAFARLHRAICKRWRTRQHNLGAERPSCTAMPCHIGSHSAAFRERKRAQRQARIRARTCPPMRAHMVVLAYFCLQSWCIWGAGLLAGAQGLGLAEANPEKFTESSQKIYKKFTISGKKI